MTNVILIYTNNVLAKPYDNPKLKSAKVIFPIYTYSTYSFCKRYS